MLRGRVQGREELPAVNDAQGKGLLVRTLLIKSVGPVALHPRLLKELADVIAKPVSLTSAQGKIMEQVLLEQVSRT